MMDDRHTISAGGISATIKAEGAELCSLTTAGGLELLWQAGPEWPRHSPWLFPIVGRLKNDQLRHRGKTYPLTQHGFARDLRFAWLERTTRSCTLQLTDSEATRARYPFAFRLTIAFRVDAASLEAKIEIENPGEEVLPASFGAHPAFNWPLAPGASKQESVLIFTENETAPIRRLSGGLMRPEGERSPIQGTRLTLSERLFDQDAIILDAPRSTAVSYIGPGGPGLTVGWDGFRELGIWSKPSGAPFLCIEPWRGYASPLEFDGEFIDKPGLMHIAPGAAETLMLRIKAHEAI
ncbi:aldose 1-epimerase family protein [Bradyrhizobium sp. HKCCYLS1011]|uniref:aldose 1-epimerase family protein n=1 Tax=Bradyrhizobium sp. HKCCYLS1011 TaxID=3420733 RepID=UPI003EB7E604